MLKLLDKLEQAQDRSKSEQRNVKALLHIRTREPPIKTSISFWYAVLLLPIPKRKLTH
jgi:hypothetical protein